MNRDEIITGWMSWKEILPFKEQLIEMEHNLMIKYHYPDWKIPLSYPASRVEELKDHLENGNTFFWGAIYKNELIGYVWLYYNTFIDHKRWHLRSIMFNEKAQGLGLGKLAIEESIEKAKYLGCDEMVTSYVPSNKIMESLLKKFHFEKSRIEVIKKLR